MRICAKALALGLGVLLFAIDARAYTLVFRSGARVEIAGTYRLDGSRLEFRDADGVSRIVQLGEVDVDATARANRESVAAFVARSSERKVSAPATPAPQPAPAARQVEPEESYSSLTITSADLEPLRIARETADAEYDARHPQQARANEPAPDDQLPPEFTREEEYAWRSEAAELRDQIDIEQSQIDAIRAELDLRQNNPMDFRLSYRYNYGNAPVFRQPNGRFVAPYGSPSGYLRADEEFAQMNSRLIDLEIRHQGTMTQWTNFLERARRRGVPPGWLRE
jgi:hypothetical protein